MSEKFTVLITGVSQGIGNAIAKKFLQSGHKVIGFDIKPKPLNLIGDFIYHCVDVSKKNQLPKIDKINILINNAGVQDEENAIAVNLLGYINVAEKYAFDHPLKSLLNMNSIATHSGIELPLYCASQGGRHAYTKNLTLRLAKNGTTVNSISAGGIITEWNRSIIEDKKLYSEVLNETLLKKWAAADEIADLAYFLTVVNKSITGQDVVIDNGEMAKYNYINDSNILNEFYGSTFNKD
ncbi:MAG: SDR family oxidoreductase [Firmicutes bacterium]|nr:SDR family oxidoreductase [Bacillota bacterium]